MPTTTRRYTAEEQAEQTRRHRALADVRKVAEFDTPAGAFEVRHTGTGYDLGGGGLRLLGITDYFAPNVSLTAVDDADAVDAARRLILERWRDEGEQMAAAFGFDSMAQAGVPREIGDAATRVVAYFADWDTAHQPLRARLVAAAGGAAWACEVGDMSDDGVCDYDRLADLMGVSKGAIRPPMVRVWWGREAYTMAGAGGADLLRRIVGDERATESEAETAALA